jgi:hypothetical protein
MACCLTSRSVPEPRMCPLFMPVAAFAYQTSPITDDRRSHSAGLIRAREIPLSRAEHCASYLYSMRFALDRKSATRTSDGFSAVEGDHQSNYIVDRRAHAFS